MMVKFVTDLGDAAFLLPASLIVACHLLVVRSRAAALTWSSTVALCAALTLLAKIASLACGHQFPSLAIHSPSGHASLSTTFCLCGALMLSAQRPPPAQIALASAGICIVVAIAASRALAVAMHGRHFGVETRLAQLVARIQRADLG